MKKTDNRNLEQKVALRSAICEALGQPLRVLDLFAGEGHIWRTMAERFEIDSYTPVDERPRMAGVIRMKVGPRTVRAFDPRQFNVIDIDCYGEPWAVWAEMRERLPSPCAVFLTFGHVQTVSCSISNFLKEANDIPLDWEIPADVPLSRFLGHRFLLRSLRGMKIGRALWSDHPGVTYYGLLIG